MREKNKRLLVIRLVIQFLCMALVIIMTQLLDLKLNTFGFWALNVCINAFGLCIALVIQEIE